MNHCRQIRAAPRQIARRELAFENGVLQMVAIPAHDLKYFAQAFVFANVITDQIGASHGLLRRELAQAVMARVARLNGAGKGASNYRRNSYPGRGREDNIPGGGE